MMRNFKKLVFLLVIGILILPLRLLATEYYVSKDGDDNNAGTAGSPFLTLNKAASIAKAGDVVNIYTGVYREILNPSNSGSAGNPIVFRGVEGESVVISAMEPLAGWTKDQGNVYKTKVDWNLGQENFVMWKSTALDLARWPDNVDGDRMTLNSLRNDGGSQDEVMTNAFLLDSDIPDWDWSNGGTVMFYGDRPGSGWTTWRAWIKSQSSGRINFDAIKNQNWIITAHPPGDLGDYFLEGIKEALDYENEWFFDVNTSELFVIIPGGIQPADEEIQMRKRVQTIDLSNKSYIEIHNLAVFGGGIALGEHCKLFGLTSLYGSMTRGINPNFNSEVNAVNIDWGKSGNVIEKCEIAYGDGTGIWDAGSGTVIKNCYIHDFNFLGSYDAPVMMRGPGGGKILYSTVSRGGRDALQITAKNAEVAYNDFSHSNLIADDCALLYTIGPDKNMSIHHNWFHDATGRGKLKKAAGIYLDNDAGEISVHRNVVWNVEWTNIQINWNGRNINIFNNTLMKADGGTMGAWHNAGTAFSNVRVWNNITDKESSDQGGNQETESTWEAQSDKRNNIIDKTSFIDHDKNDFKLKTNGLAVDAGITIVEPMFGPDTKILDYTSGYVGSAPDIGAYEIGDEWVPGIDWDLRSGPAGNCYGLPGELCNLIAVTGVSISPSVLTLTNIGDSATLVAVVQPDTASEKGLVWTSSKPTVASVENGLVKAVGNGQAEISVKTVDGDFTAIAQVTVDAPLSAPTGESLLSIYPNPWPDDQILILSLGKQNVKAKISFIDASGRQVKVFKGMYRLEIHKNELPYSGLYIIVAEFEDGVTSRYKLIVN